MDSVYLSAQTPRWLLTSEEHLQAALDGGFISESHYLDVKRELPTTKGGNRELARDMASFAIDGGTLIIGLEEDKTTGTYSLSPQPLKGSEEHVEQVARAIADPALAVTTRRIPSQADPDTGYLIIHVPPSPVAPHMVDNRYLGRGDKTKYYLPDPEVVRLHERRRATEADALALLQAEFDRDPIPAERREQAHLFLLAEPVAAPPEMLLALTSGPGWNQRLGEFAARAHTAEVNQALAYTGGFSPDLDYASNGARRPRGAARADHRLATDRTLREDARDEDVVELEVHEDGGLRIFMGRLSDTMDDGEKVLFDTAAVIYVRRLLALVRAAAEEGGYFGNWVLALGATGLRGCRSYLLQMHWPGGGSDPRYTDDIYRQATRASYAELVANPGQVAELLLGRLLRALGTSERHPAAHPTSTASATVAPSR